MQAGCTLGLSAQTHPDVQLQMFFHHGLLLTMMDRPLKGLQLHNHLPVTEMIMIMTGISNLNTVSAFSITWSLQVS